MTLNTSIKAFPFFAFCKSKGMLLFFLLLPGYIHAQYFNHLYDYDSTTDWGDNIFLDVNDNYFIIGHTTYPNWGLSSIGVNKDGSNILFKNIIVNNGIDIYRGMPGRAKKLSMNEYLLPYTLAIPNPHPGIDIYQMSGYVVLDNHGDTVETRLYTDTTQWADMLSDCEMMPDGGYLLVGKRTSSWATNPEYSGLLWRTDSIGNLLWTKTYQKEPGRTTVLNSVQYIDNGNILIGATSNTLVLRNGQHYYRESPWFMLVDSTNGNIIKDTFYNKGYAGGVVTGGGNIFKDKNGGYFHWGQLDTVVVDTVLFHEVNFFPYFAHLDENFHVDNIKVWPTFPDSLRRYIWTIKQTSDNGYLLMGSRVNWFKAGGYLGWAAKLNKYGFVEWESDYYLDTIFHGYIVDGIETQDGGYVLTGGHRDSDSLSARGNDFWLIGVDSNGCLVPGCEPTTIQGLPKPPGNFHIKIYPNPTSGALHIEMQQRGNYTIRVMNMLGVTVYEDKMADEQKKYILLDNNLPAGNYIIQLTGADGTRVTEKVVKR